ncbi:putative ribonuclease H-like domain-containing protein [Tanacetum coccineum]
MDEFCREKGIKREYSVARTPQQNGVAERKNRTLIEAARTMLADSKLPTTFWAEVVSTACYVSLLDYSLNSKALGSTTLEPEKFQENLHVGFLENKPMIEGNGPKWLFDLDSLTQSMNYVNHPGKEVNTGSRDVSTALPESLNMLSWKTLYQNEFIKLLEIPAMGRSNAGGTSSVQTANGLDSCRFYLRPSCLGQIDDVGICMSTCQDFEDTDHPDKVIVFVQMEISADVDEHLYRSMIGSLMYLTASRPDIMFVKQTVVATSTTEAEYVAAASCCGQKIPVQHSKTKHIEIRHHFIRDCNAKKLIQMAKIDTQHNVADLLTKGFDAGRFQYLVSSIGMLNP